MAIPSINDLIKYTTSKLTGAAWNSNLTKIVNWFTDGTADISVKTLTTSGSQTIAGAQNIAGNLTVSGTTTSTGNITTSGYFVGDGSLISNLNTTQSKNFIINGGCILVDNAPYTLINNTYGTSVSRMYGMASGTAVSAGIFTQNTSSTIGRTGYSAKFSGCTITGTGLIYYRYRIASKNAKILKNQNLSFSCKCYQDTGAPINFTIYANKANAVDNFAAVTAISNSGAQGVADSAEVSLKYENFAAGDCSNGLEIIIKAECGAITTKNFEFTELQLEIGTTASSFNYETINLTAAINSYNSSFSNPVILTSTASSINLTGLDGNTDIMYKIYAYFITAGTTTGASILYLQMNGDTENNYVETGSTVDKLDLGSCATIHYNFIQMNVYAKSGGLRMICGNGSEEGSYEIMLNGYWNNTTDNLTSLQFKTVSDTGTRTFEAGTRIEIYAVR
jgi:hypothetical protein